MLLSCALFCGFVQETAHAKATVYKTNHESGHYCVLRCAAAVCGEEGGAAVSGSQERQAGGVEGEVEIRTVGDCYPRSF